MQEICRGDFVIINELKQTAVSANHRMVPVLELLEYYSCILRGAVSMNIVVLYKKSYVKMTAHELDDFCKWIYDMRESEFFCNELNFLICMHSLYITVFCFSKG